MTSQPEARNHLIDVARVASVLVVVVFHGLLYQIGVVDGSPTVIPWGPDYRWWIASWFFMIMPVFFVAGGYAHAVSVDSLARRGESYAHYLANRGRRLVGPLVVFLGASTLVSSVAAWTMDAGRAIELSRQFAQLLWFIAVYLIIVAAAPWLVRAHDRWGAAVPVPFLVAAIAIDAWSFAVGDHEVRYWNLLTVWPLCHQLGIAYQRGWFRRGPMWRPLLAVLAAAVTIPLLIRYVGYPLSAVGLATIPIANVQPPTVAMAVLGLAQAGALGLLERAGVLRTFGPRAERLVAVAGALLMTTYLWHIPCILLAGALLFGVSRLVPDATGLLLSQPSVVVVTLAIIVALVPLIGRLDLRLIPRLGVRPRVRPTVTAFAVLTAGVGIVWRNGTTLHPAAPWSVLGLLAFFAGAVLLARAAAGEAVP